MTNFLRHASHKGLLFVAVVFTAALAAGTALAAGALSGSGAKPPAKPLDAAVHDALAAKPVEGVTARIKFTNKLITSSNLQGTGSNPLLTGATGRLWAAADGRLRLELQSDGGDAQISSDGTTASLYDAKSNTVYRMALPKPDAGKDAKDGAHGAPSLKQVQDAIAHVAESAGLSGATPTDVAGHPAYSVRATPKRDGGLVGAAQLAWDAATGTPLRLALYATGTTQPVLELTATDITYGPVDAAALAAKTPAGAKVVTVDTPSKPGSGGNAGGSSKSSFSANAPAKLAGMARSGVRQLDHGALVTYGQGPGGIAVLEQPASADGKAAPPTKVVTALGTLLRFQRGGVEYTVAGSVPETVADAAARAL
jgi:outer membrane lipoprotein-sorting protein